MLLSKVVLKDKLSSTLSNVFTLHTTTIIYWSGGLMTSQLRSWHKSTYSKLKKKKVRSSFSVQHCYHSWSLTVPWLFAVSKWFDTITMFNYFTKCISKCNHQLKHNGIKNDRRGIFHAPVVWKTLPPQMRKSTPTDRLKKRLKGWFTQTWNFTHLL